MVPSDETSPPDAPRGESTSFTESSLIPLSDVGASTTAASAALPGSIVGVAGGVLDGASAARRSTRREPGHEHDNARSDQGEHETRHRSPGEGQLRCRLER